jgi:glycosyltransferase involved in cell wall biosynthesis
MRIAYVVLNLEEMTMLGGVGKKIKAQIKLWRELTHEVRVFILAPNEFVFDGILSYSFKFIERKYEPSIFIQRELSRIKMLKTIIQEVEIYKPDIIYFRYGLYTFPLHRLFLNIPGVIEINTNDVDEYRYRGWFYYWYNRFTRSIIFKQAAGIVTPTHELGQMSFNQVYGKPLTVISNGIDLNEFRSLPPTTNKIPVLAFVATPGFPWNGFDKIIKFAVLCQDIKFQIIGYGRGDNLYEIPMNVELMGFLNKEEIREALKNVDAVFGTLALHRKKMEEACPLKVREALAYGLPLIYAYKDTDLENINSDCLLRLPNTENNMIENFDRIRKFAYCMRGKRLDRQLVSSRIDQRKKEIERLIFFEDFLLSNKI